MCGTYEADGSVVFCCCFFFIFFVSFLLYFIFPSFHYFFFFFFFLTSSYVLAGLVWFYGISTTIGYRTLHSYNLIWVVCHLFPQQNGGRTHIQSRETIGQENHGTCVKLRPRVNFVQRLEPLPRHVFSINKSSSNILSLFTQILRSGYTLSLQCDVLLIHQQA